jgi:hypothetical protein
MTFYLTFKGKDHVHDRWVLSCSKIVNKMPTKCFLKCQVFDFLKKNIRRQINQATGSICSKSIKRTLYVKNQSISDMNLTLFIRNLVYPTE